MNHHGLRYGLVVTLMILSAILVPRLNVRAATYHVAQSDPKSDDTNAGTEAAPWKSIPRAATAKELKSGDSVLIHTGVYREHVDVRVSGAAGKPITFAAALGARVVIKGSEIVRGPWTKLVASPDRKEPYPGAFTDVWKVRLDDEFFTDARFQGSYQDKARRWVSQVFVNDDHALQRIGPDPIYKNKENAKLTTVGRTRDDLIDGSFFLDPADQTLYLKTGGEPGWSSIEVGVRGFVLTA